MKMSQITITLLFLAFAIIMFYPKYRRKISAKDTGRT